MLFDDEGVDVFRAEEELLLLLLLLLEEEDEDETVLALGVGEGVGLAEGVADAPKVTGNGSVSDRGSVAVGVGDSVGDGDGVSISSVAAATFGDGERGIGVRPASGEPLHPDKAIRMTAPYNRENGPTRFIPILLNALFNETLNVVPLIRRDIKSNYFLLLLLLYHKFT